jgi:membrane-associated phospholipid phosphatase
MRHEHRLWPCRCRAAALVLTVAHVLGPSSKASAAEPEVDSAHAPTGAPELEPADGEAAPGVTAFELESYAVAVDVRVDVPVGLTAGLLALGLQLGRNDIVRQRCQPRCFEAGMNGLDRPFAGRYVAAAATASDVLLVVNLGLPVALDLLELGLGEHPAGWSGWGEDTLIMAETLTLNAAAQSLTSFAVQRPRPFTYGELADLDQRTGANAYLSFYSGHTSNSFAAATAYAYLFGVRHPRSPWRAAVWALGEGLAAMDGALRVTAGYHFPSDVLVGAAVGTTLGVLIPWLHTRETAGDAGPGATERSCARASRRTPSSVAWLLLPAVAPGSVGLTVLLR